MGGLVRIYGTSGYIAMGLATLVAIPALDTVGFEKWLRRSFVVHALVTPLFGVVYFYPTFSTRLLFVGLPWAITAPLFMCMLAVLLRTGGDGGAGGAACLRP